MSVHSGPETTTDGLIFEYDMTSTQKSWKGKPTTNLTNVGLSGMTGVSLSYLGLEDGWKKYSMSGTFTGGTYPYTLNITGYSFSAGVTYSSACYVKTNVMHKFNYFGNGMNYVNEPMNKSGTSVGVLQPDGSYYCGRINFAYTNTTSQVGYILSNPINNTTFNPATDFVWIKDGQIELGEFPTPFAGDAGTRSTTQALVDLTGRSTVTVNNLIYNSDNTFNFLASSPSSIQVPLATALNKLEGTINVWIYPTSYNGGNGIFVNRTDTTANAVDWLWIGPYSGTFYFRLGDGSACCSNDLTISNYYSVVPVNTWTNLCCTWKSAGTSVIYINGNLYTSRSISAIPATNPAANGLFGCGHANADGYFNGKMPIAQIYNRQLTASEVKQNFNAFRGRFSL